MQRIMADVANTLSEIVPAQRKLLAVSGTAWSDDRLVKVVVGPRGQLVDLEIDPRLGNRPNMAALARTILATAQAATEQAMAQSREIMDRELPEAGEVRDIPAFGGFDPTDLLSRTDAELYRRNHGTDNGRG